MIRKNSPLSPAIALVFSWTSTYIFIIPFCGFLFKCGCTWLWAGAAEKCVGMMDQHGAHHHCPWCSDAPFSFFIPISAILVTQAALIILLWWRYRTHILVQFAAGLFAFLAVGYLESLIHGWFSNYPH
jgi:hypothetical protein